MAPAFKRARRVVVFGGGPAALAAAVELATRGVEVDLVGPVEPAHWPVAPSAGIDVGCDPERLFDETIVGGCYAAARAPVRSLAHAAAALARWLEAIGVPFARDGEGALALRRLDGTAAAGAAFVEARTTPVVMHLLAALASGCEGLTVRTHQSLLALVRGDDGRCLGVVLGDNVSMSVAPLAADAVLLVSGGLPLGLGRSVAALASESALAVAAASGAVLADFDRVQREPFAAPATGRDLLLPNLRAEGARVWLPSDEQDERRGRDVPASERDYLLEQSHPGWGGRVPDDIASVAIRRQLERGRGIYDRRSGARHPLAYLDASHLPEAHLRARLGGEHELCRTLLGLALAREPVPVRPVPLERLGGLWVGFEADADGRLVADSPHNHATSIEGLYAAGGSTGWLYHGANRLGGNALLGDLFGGRTAAGAITAYVAALDAEPDGPFAAVVADACRRREALAARQGPETAPVLLSDLQRQLREQAVDPTDPARIDALDDALDELAARFDAAGPGDEGAHANRGVSLLAEVDQLIDLGRMTVRCARVRWARAPEAGARRLLSRFRPDGDIELLEQVDATLLGRPHRGQAAIDPDGIDPASRPRSYGKEGQAP